LVRSSECVDYQVRECHAEQHRSDNRKGCDNKWRQQQRIERHRDNAPSWKVKSVFAVAVVESLPTMFTTGIFMTAPQALTLLGIPKTESTFGS
jgi:hypothetical protein